MIRKKWQAETNEKSREQKFLHQTSSQDNFISKLSVPIITKTHTSITDQDAELVFKFIHRMLLSCHAKVSKPIKPDFLAKMNQSPLVAKLIIVDMIFVKNLLSNSIAWLLHKTNMNG